MWGVRGDRREPAVWENRTESDPPAPDPLEDMDCGEDRQDACLIPSAEAEASMHAIADTIALMSGQL